MKKQQRHPNEHERRESALSKHEPDRYPPIEERSTDRRLVLWRPPQVWEEWARPSPEKEQLQKHQVQERRDA